MAKPLFRWIMGNTSHLGPDVLKESVKMSLKVFGKESFDWIICSNATSPQIVNQINSISSQYNVPVVQSSWEDFPLDPSIIPQKYDIDEAHGIPSGDRQGSFWKMCPPRMRVETHEIVIDNDLVFLKKLPQIKEFLSSQKTLLSQEDAHSVGKYFKFFKKNEIYNSGLMGFPPHYDLEEKLKEGWERLGSFQPLLSRDEQGLLTSVLTEHPHIVVTKGLIVHALPQGRTKHAEYKIINEHGQPAKIITRMNYESVKFTSHNYGYHFLGINRTDSHPVWEEYIKRNILSSI